MSLLCGFTGRHLPCRDAEADPMITLTMEIPHLPVDTVVDAPICKWDEFHGCRRGEDSSAPTVAPAEELVTCSSELRVDFLGPCTQVQGRGSCPQGHGHHNQMHALAFIDKDIRHTSRPHHYHHKSFPLKSCLF